MAFYIANGKTFQEGGQIDVFSWFFHQSGYLTSCTDCMTPLLEDTWEQERHWRKFNIGSTGQGSDVMWSNGVVSV
jgi:hypothetical protein